MNTKTCHYCETAMDEPRLSVLCDEPLARVLSGLDWPCGSNCGQNAHLCQKCAFAVMFNELVRRWKTSTPQETAARILDSDTLRRVYADVYESLKVQ